MPDKCVIIAEAGVNHNGSIELAYKLIEAAHAAGADYVKFQTFVTEEVMTADVPRAAYQIANSASSRQETQLEMIKRLELPREEFWKLDAYCRRVGIKFLSTPHDVNSARFLADFKMDYVKVASGDLPNFLMLQTLADIGQPIILSTGMSTLDEIKKAVEFLHGRGMNADKVTLLHCVTDYPTPAQDANLRVMDTLAQTFRGYKIGFSDHTLGIEIALAAVARGACVIEKHFTLDKNMDGPDHRASLEPGELKELVRSCHNIGMALGDGTKRMTSAEEATRKVAGKSIISIRDIKKGDIFSEENIAVLRPGTGMSPMLWGEIIGTKAPHDYKKNEPLQSDS